MLNVTSHFFEFVAEEERDDPGKTFLTADQLESNREYYIYFTTSSGLYRYDINDVVRVVDFYRRTPVIQFVRKGQGMTSITGEKLTESQVTGALCEVVDANGFDVQHFTACVEWGEPPHYALYAELGDGDGQRSGSALRRRVRPRRSACRTSSTRRSASRSGSGLPCSNASRPARTRRCGSAGSPRAHRRRR